MPAIHSRRVAQKQCTAIYEDYIYKDLAEAIYRVSSKDDVYCIISSDHMTRVSKLNSLYNILVKFI